VKTETAAKPEVTFQPPQHFHDTDAVVNGDAVDNSLDG
jgi:hypothetical protein